MDTVDPDTLVSTFLESAKEAKISAIVTYGYQHPLRGPVMCQSANVGPAAIAAALKHMKKVDDDIVDAAAKALHESVLSPCCNLSVPWLELEPADYERHIMMARMILTAAKDHVAGTARSVVTV